VPRQAYASQIELALYYAFYGQPVAIPPEAARHYVFDGASEQMPVVGQPGGESFGFVQVAELHWG